MKRPRTWRSLLLFKARTKWSDLFAEQRHRKNFEARYRKLAALKREADEHAQRET